MAAVIVDPKKVRSFKSEAEFEGWLAKHHDRETELWLKIHKKGSGLPTVTNRQAIDVALCWGWIDGLRKGFDEQSFLQRFSPRKPRSIWSQINRENVERLSAARRMTPHGQRHVDAAKGDGRWDAAYRISDASAETVPADLRAAIEASAKAHKVFAQLNRQNLFAITFRTNNMKTPAGRQRKIATLVAMLERGETIVPQRMPDSARAVPLPAPRRRGAAAKPGASKKTSAHARSKLQSKGNSAQFADKAAAKRAATEAKLARVSKGDVRAARRARKA
jgi:uncharacterized protein YdeI (YjbR/CyaY-like superfamily)